MALINCKECNHEISDSAVSCPQCGFQNSGVIPSGIPKPLISLNSLDDINSVTKVTMLISFLALIISMTSTGGSYIGLIIVVLLGGFTMFMAMAYRSRITLAVIIIFWIFTINRSLMQGTAFGTTISDIGLLIHIGTLGFSIYLFGEYKKIFK